MAQDKKKAGAPVGNKNAEVWTLDQAQKFINDLYENIESNVNCTSIEAAACELGQYEAAIYYLREKYKEIDFEPIKKAKAIIKGRLIENGLKNKYNPTMCIFVLKNNHDMDEKQVIETPDLKIHPLQWFNNDTDKDT